MGSREPFKLYFNKKLKLAPELLSAKKRLQAGVSESRLPLPSPPDSQHPLKLKDPLLSSGSQHLPAFSIWRAARISTQSSGVVLKSAMAAIAQPQPPPRVVQVSFLGTFFLLFVSDFKMAYLWSGLWGMLFLQEPWYFKCVIFAGLRYLGMHILH